MTYRTLIAGRPNPYLSLYDATRVKPMASAYDYAAENVAFPAHLMKDRLTSLGSEIDRSSRWARRRGTRRARVRS
jgi:hypothetical protein